MLCIKAFLMLELTCFLKYNREFMKNLLSIMLVVFGAGATFENPIPDSQLCPVAQNGRFKIGNFLVSVSYPNVNIFKLPIEQDDRPTTSSDNVAKAFIAAPIVALFLTRNRDTATTLSIHDLANDRTDSIQGVLMDTVRLSIDGRMIQYAIRTKPKRVVTMQLGHGSQSDE